MSFPFSSSCTENNHFCSSLNDPDLAVSEIMISSIFHSKQIIFTHGLSNAKAKNTMCAVVIQQLGITIYKMYHIYTKMECALKYTENIRSGSQVLHGMPAAEKKLNKLQKEQAQC